MTTADFSRARSRIVVFDSYAWLEYAMGNPRAEDIASYLENDEVEILTPSTVLAEVGDVLRRNAVAKETRNQVITYIKGKSLIVSIDSTIAESAGEINFVNNVEKKIKNWEMLDSMVYAVATERRGRVLTGDPHFKDLKDIIYIGI
jgi:predicted nucleic acid-binding protein